MDIKSNFSLRLSQVLQQKFPGQEQKMIAPKLNTTQPSLSEWLSGKKMPSLKRFFEICDILDVSVEWLALGRGNPMQHKEIKETSKNYQFRKDLEELHNLVNKLGRYDIQD